jgi:ketosteroid isomerase-like protein
MGRQEDPMTTLEVGNRLVALCREGQDEKVVNTLYDKNIVSVEAADMPNMPREQKGIGACHAKAKWWSENNTVHSAKIDGPFPHGDRFAVRFTYDITRKADGKRNTMDEIALYTVKDGKIVREEFFYNTGG